jgi:primary-amine oxidase
LPSDRGVGATWRFASIELKEPGKDTLLALEAGEMTCREALVVCWNRVDGQAHRAVVSLTSAEVTSWEHLPGQQPNMTVDEWHECLGPSWVRLEAAEGYSMTGLWPCSVR